jgi:IclR family acetate operon transcriptional repressor
MGEMGMVDQTEDGRYVIGLRLFEIGSRAAARAGLSDVAAPHLRALSEKWGETAHLGIRDGIEFVYVEKFESRASIRMSSQVGARNPLYCTGMGKALLAYSTTEVFESVCAAGLAPRTTLTKSDPTALATEIDRIRERGFSIDDEELEVGLRCVAAPVIGNDGGAIAAISLSGPSTRLDPDRCLAIGPELIGTSIAIAEANGQRPPRRIA